MVKEYKIVIDYDADNAPKVSTKADDAVSKPTSEIASRNATTQAIKYGTVSEKEVEAVRKERIATGKTAVALTVAATNYAVDLALTHRQTTLAIQGDYLAAENLGKKAAVYREIGSAGANIASGAAFMALAGGSALAGGAVVAGALALSYAKRALQLVQEQRAYRAEGAKQQYEYNLNAERLVRNYSRYR